MADPYAYPVERRQHRPDLVGVLVLLVVHMLIDYRLELTLLAVLALPVTVAARNGWRWLGGAGESALIVLILALRPTRPWLGRILYAAWVRRRFVHAVQVARISS